MLELTGERYHPFWNGTIRYEHLHRYGMCLALAEGLDVLDIASGEGYGTALLASRAKHAIGVDVDVQAVEHAKHRYYRQNLRYLVGDCAALPLPDHSVDLVVSFETIEHTEAHDQFLAEIGRVLRPSGKVVISSPNKLVYSDEPGYTNPYHVRELYYDEFAELLQRNFAAVRIYGQRLAAASFVFPLAEQIETTVTTLSARGSAVEAGIDPLRRPMYFVAVCSNVTLDDDELCSLFVDPADDVLDSLQAEYRQHLAQARAVAQSELAALQAQAAPLRLSGAHDGDLSRALQEAIRIQQTLEAQLAAKDDRSQAAEEQIALREQVTELRAGQARELAERAALEQDLVQARNALEESRRRADESECAAQAERQAAAAARRDTAERCAQLEELRADHGRSESRADGLAGEVAALRDSLDQAAVRTATLLADRSALRGGFERTFELQNLLGAQIGFGLSDLPRGVARVRPEDLERAREAERLRAEHAELQRRCAELERSLEREQSALGTARAAAERLEREHQLARAAGDEAREQLDSTQAELRSAAEQAERQSALLHEMVASRSWRMTLPLRRLALKLKRGGQ